MIEDLQMIRGWPPNRPPSGKFTFEKLAHFGFDQVDDYWGIKSFEDKGTDVVIWLFPLEGQTSVYHYRGPFTGLRLDYDVLRNPVRRIPLFLQVVSSFSETLHTEVIYSRRNMSLGHPPNLSVIKEDITQIVNFWQAKEIEPGSSGALMVHR